MIRKNQEKLVAETRLQVEREIEAKYEAEKQAKRDAKDALVKVMFFRIFFDYGMFYHNSIFFI